MSEWMSLRDAVVREQMRTLLDAAVDRVVQRGRDEVIAQFVTMLETDPACTE